MMVKLLIKTPPTAEPVKLEEAKLHLRVDGDDENLLISGLITAAREYCESYQNRAYITQTLEMALDEWPCGNVIELPRPPLQSVTSVEYTDSEGNTTIWETSNYMVDDYSFVARIVRKQGWPSAKLAPTNGIKIQYIAGYPPKGEDLAANVPQRVKQAILLLVGHWYENRESVLIGSISKQLEFTVHSLLSVDRVIPI